MDVSVSSLSDEPDFMDTITGTSELALMLLLGCARRIRFLEERVHHSRSWINTDLRGQQLSGKTLGLVGLGRLGRLMASYGVAMGMSVQYFDPNVFENNEKIRKVDFDHLLQTSDFISLHAKLNDQNKKMICVDAVEKMKKGVVLINTARGALIDSSAVLRGLENGKIASVGLDVANGELSGLGLPEDPLVCKAASNKNIIVTPHIGGATVDAHGRIFKKVADQISKALNLS